MSKFNKWLNGEENFFDVEVRVKPLKENKQSIEEITQICLKLKSFKISNRKIADILKIDRNKVDRILKKRH